MSHNEELLPIGTLYINSGRNCVFLLTNYTYSKYSTSTVIGYSLKRVNDDENFWDVWEPGLNKGNWVNEKNVMLYLPKEHNVRK